MTDHPVGELCGSKKKQGTGTCTKPAGWGTDHVGFGNCKLHGGASPNGVKHAEKQEAAWRQRLADELDPSVKYMADVRDDDTEKTRERLAAAGKLVDTGVKVLDDSGDTQVTVIFNMDDLP